MLDKEKWSIEDLLRYSALLKKQLDAQVLPEGALSDDEVRQLEKYRLGIGITPYVDTPRPGCD